MYKVYGIIYKATNKINGKMYIGQTVGSLNRRIVNHISKSLSKKDNFYFHGAIRKYGKENFVWEIIAKCNSLEELNKTEVEMIEKYNAFGDGYNLTEGGEGIAKFKHTDESRKKMSEARKGEKNHMYGRPQTDEAKKKISESHKGKKSYMWGKHHTEGTKRKISDANKGEKSYLYGKYGDKHNMSQKYIITTPEGKEIFVHGLRDFCKNYKKDVLCSSTLIQVAYGKRNHHKGYKCKRLYEEVIICQN